MIYTKEQALSAIRNDVPALDWEHLTFSYMPTDFNVRVSYRNGAWGEVEVWDEEVIPMHMAATCLHYGQECFEGLKAFRGVDGKVRLFRPEANAERMQMTCRGVVMPELPTERFIEMADLAVRLNQRFIPPTESGASLYLRPLLIGTGPQVGVKPADEYLFMIFVTPVGPYFKEGFHATDFCITRRYDRAAPLGTGRYKVGGNYAASLRAHVEAAQMGYSSEFYLDAKEKKYIDECGAANFFGIKQCVRDGVPTTLYVTPESTSILPSITNRSLQQLAREEGMEVECRHIPVEELSEFSEAGACGTAAVISAIRHIDDPATGKRYSFAIDGTPGPVCQRLYKHLRAIQYGAQEDVHGWNHIVTL